jgi:phosphoglucomutase
MESTALSTSAKTRTPCPPAQQTALEVLAANGVDTIIQSGNGDADTRHLARHSALQPRPKVAPRRRHRRHSIAQSAGGWRIQVQPAKRRPRRYDVTAWIQDRANELLRQGNAGVKRVGYNSAMRAATTTEEDFICPTCATCGSRRHGGDPGRKTHAGVDPLGGAARPYWEPINSFTASIFKSSTAARSHLFLHDGRPRRANPHGLLQPLCDGAARGVEGSISGGLRQRSGLRPARDRDAFLGADEPQPLSRRGDSIPAHAPPGVEREFCVGKTVVSSGMIDRVVAGLGRGSGKFRLDSSGSCRDCSTSCCFGGEESAGASFLRFDGSVWTTDKDGLIMDLLAAEITARTGKDPGRALSRSDG